MSVYRSHISLCVVLWYVNHYIDGWRLWWRQLVCSWRHVLQLYTWCADCVVIECVSRCLEWIWLRLWTVMAWREMNLYTFLQLSRCLSRWIHLSVLFVRSDPAVSTDIYISVTCCVIQSNLLEGEVSSEGLVRRGAVCGCVCM